MKKIKNLIKKIKNLFLDYKKKLIIKKEINKELSGVNKSHFKYKHSKELINNIFRGVKINKCFLDIENEKILEYEDQKYYSDLKKLIDKHYAKKENELKKEINYYKSLTKKLEKKKKHNVNYSDINKSFIKD